MDTFEHRGLSGPAFAAAWLRRAGLGWAANLVEVDEGSGPELLTTKLEIAS